MYHRRQQECVEDKHTDVNKRSIRIETGFESQKYASQRSIQQDMEWMDIPIYDIIPIIQPNRKNPNSERPHFLEFI